MTSGVLARRYAAALFDVTLKTGGTDRALTDLRALRDLIGGHDELRKVLSSPAIPAGRKRPMIEAVMARAGLGSPEVTRLVELMAERDRLSVLDAVTSAFEARVNELKKVMPAEVVTAQPLDETGRAAIAGALARATGSDVRITERVDPSLVGGVVARVGSFVFDGSVIRQLERMRQRLLSGA